MDLQLGDVLLHLGRQIGLGFSKFVQPLLVRITSLLGALFLDVVERDTPHLVEELLIRSQMRMFEDAAGANTAEPDYPVIILHVTSPFSTRA